MLPDDVRSYSLPRAAQAEGPPTGRSAAPSGGMALTYDLPDGWVDRGPSGMRLATLLVGVDGGEVTIIPASGTLESNAARWQEQLTPGGNPDLLSQAIAAGQQIRVNGVEATLLLLTDGAAENPQAILGAMIPVDPASALFIKFKGPASVARAIRDPFTEFLRSIRWN